MTLSIKHTCTANFKSSFMLSSNQHFSFQYFREPVLAQSMYHAGCFLTAMRIKWVKKLYSPERYLVDVNSGRHVKNKHLLLVYVMVE